MNPIFKTFDMIANPVAAVNPENEVVYMNSSFSALRASGGFSDFQHSHDEKQLFICENRGEIKCFSCEKSSINHDTLWLFTDVTAFITRKSMVETLSIDEHNITKDNLKKIIEKNRRLSEVIDIMDSAIMVEGSSGNIIQLNRAFLKMIAWSDGFSVKEDYDADDCHNKLASMAVSNDYFKIKDEITSRNVFSTYTDEIMFKDGRVFKRYYHPLFVSGSIKGCLWKFRDITVRKQMELFKNELEAVISALEASETVGIFLDFKGFKFANKGLLNLLGTDRNTIKSKGLENFIQGRIYPKDGSPLERTIDITKPNGETSKVMMLSDIVRLNSTDVSVISLRDITLQDKLEKSLRENEEKFRTIFEDNSAIMLIFDPNTMNILDVNRSAAEYYGLSKETLLSRKMCQIVMSSSQTECHVMINNILSHGSGARLTIKGKLGDGTVRDMELKITPINISGVTVMFVIIEDVSERVLYQTKLEEMNVNLKNLVDAEIDKRRKNEELLMEKMRLAEIGEMIGSIAHQWRQPLNTLGLLIQDIGDAEDFGDLSHNYIGDFVKNGMRQIDFMSRTIDDFRDFFKPSKKTEIFDVKESVSQVLSIIKPQLKNKNIDCVVVCSCGKREKIETDMDLMEVCPDHDMRIRGFHNEFKQVILNLISNSRDAVVNKHIKIIKIRLSVDEKFVTLAVEDTGGGIPNELINKIFEPYFTTKGDNGGTGIGLYMSKAIIEENMKGSLSVENTDTGCRFTITMSRVTQ